MGKFNLDFVGIGAAKAGTSWIASCLSEHPQICLSKPKELNYFCEKHTWPTTPTNYHKGESWLRRHFKHCEPGQIYGEFSVCYLIDPKSPDLLHRHNPDTTILVSFRNPIDGLYSFYYSVSKRYAVPGSFEAFLGKNPEFMEYGLYFKHIMRFFNNFPKEKIHIILYDDILIDPLGVLTKVFIDLGIASDFVPDNLYTRKNQRQGVRSIFLRDAVGNTVDYFRKNPKAALVTNIVRSLGAAKVVEWLHVMNMRDISFSPMNMTTRAKLIDYYMVENLKLGDLIQRDLSSWNE